MGAFYFINKLDLRGGDGTLLIQIQEDSEGSNLKSKTDLWDNVIFFMTQVCLDWIPSGYLQYYLVGIGDTETLCCVLGNIL